MKTTISSFMTPSPHTIGVNASLAEARKRMNQYRIRHLPVLDGGSLVGLLSQRDIQLLETFKDVNPAKVRVEEAMSQDVLTVPPEAALAAVAKKMADRRVGSAVVLRNEEVLGIFTTVDALNAIGVLLGDKPVKRAVLQTSKALTRTKPVAR